MMPTGACASSHILGVSALYHDSAACLLRDGSIVAAAQEERFTRRKHDAGIPLEAMRFCLAEGGIALQDLRSIVFYEKPFTKFERLLETYLAFAPRGIRSFMAAMPVWLKNRLFFKSEFQRTLSASFSLPRGSLPAILFAEHHESHAASAFYPSPFASAAVLCTDGVGEWTTTSAWMGENEALTPLWEIQFPHSLGLLYSAFTYHLGFKVNSDEYKVMGLAPYGEPRFVQTILDHLIDVKADGTFRLNMEHFAYCTGLRMTRPSFGALFESRRREPEGKLTQRDMDIARSIQEVAGEIMVRLARTVRHDTGARFLCLAGGVSLNCVANARVLRETGFDDIWIQPASGDAGGALGAAFLGWHRFEGKAREAPKGRDGMRGCLLGPSYSETAVRGLLEEREIPHVSVDDAELVERVSIALVEEKVVGWFQGRMEFGPRALGNRSILGDPRSPRMQSVMNLRIKFRESFRPFAPAVLRERLEEFFELDRDSPYMLLVAPVAQRHRAPADSAAEGKTGLELLKVVRSDVPAVTHVDFSARIQTVDRETNPLFYALIRAFEAKTGYGLVVNTSFNVRDEPIVCSPEDALRCFARTGLDLLVLGNCLVYKSEQQPHVSRAVKQRSLAHESA